MLFFSYVLSYSGNNSSAMWLHVKMPTFQYSCSTNITHVQITSLRVEKKNAVIGFSFHFFFLIEYLQGTISLKPQIRGKNPFKGEIFDVFDAPLAMNFYEISVSILRHFFHLLGDFRTKILQTESVSLRLKRWSCNVILFTCQEFVKDEIFLFVRWTSSLS